MKIGIDSKWWKWYELSYFYMLFVLAKYKCWFQRKTFENTKEHPLFWCAANSYIKMREKLPVCAQIQSVV
jgi:hypothetical protein